MSHGHLFQFFWDILGELFSNIYCVNNSKRWKCLYILLYFICHAVRDGFGEASPSPRCIGDGVGFQGSLDDTSIGFFIESISQSRALSNFGVVRLRPTGATVVTWPLRKGQTSEASNSCLVLAKSFFSLWMSFNLSQMLVFNQRKGNYFLVGIFTSHHGNGVLGLNFLSSQQEFVGYF